MQIANNLLSNTFETICCQAIARLNHKELPLHMHEDVYNQKSVELQLQLEIN